MNNIANRAAMCQVLMKSAETDRDIVVLCSDSRGSGSMTPFAAAYPEQFIEIGIAEQNLVGVAAGLASCGKKAFAVSPASFISTRSYEQIKVDCAYSHTNVKLIGISGGISYGALGMSHHSAQDIAAMTAIPGMRVYIPSDRFQTEKLFIELLKDEDPAYIRLGRNPVEDIYSETDISFELNKATKLRDGDDILIIACGELVKAAIDTADILLKKGIECAVLDMYCLKPFDDESLLKFALNKKMVVTLEEHSPFGGLGSIVTRILSENNPIKTKCFALPDKPVITGKSQEVFDYYGLNGIAVAEYIEKEIGEQ